MNPIKIRTLLLSLALSTLFACQPEDPEFGFGLEFINGFEVAKNPTGSAPLTAIIRMTTVRQASIRIRIIGRNGPASDIEVEFPGIGTNFELPILGLYPGYANEIELIFTDQNGNELGSQINTIQTEPLPDDFPEIRIDQENLGGIKPGYTLVNYFGFSENAIPQRAFMFDEFGDIRWYLDYSSNPVLKDLFYDVGLSPMRNGNLFSATVQRMPYMKSMPLVLLRIVGH